MEKWRGMRGTGKSWTWISCLNSNFLMIFTVAWTGLVATWPVLNINASLRPISDAARRQKAAQLHHAPATRIHHLNPPRQNFFIVNLARCMFALDYDYRLPCRLCFALHNSTSSSSSSSIFSLLRKFLLRQALMTWRTFVFCDDKARKSF